MNEKDFSGADSENQASHRVENDFLGEMAIPADAFYGIHTARAMENFPLSGILV